MPSMITNNRIVIFGASSSFGVGDEQGLGIAGRLQRSPRPLRLSSGVFNLGIGGTTTDDMVQRVEIEFAARNPALTILLTGSNDIPRINDDNPDKRVPLDRHEKNLRIIMKTALSHGHLLLLSPFPIDLAQCNTAPQVYQDYVDLQKKVVAELMSDLNGAERDPQHLDKPPVVDYIDLYTMITEDMRQEFQAEDGLHYNQHGHQFMYEQVYAWINRYF